MSREQQLAEALVGPADSFADDVDPVVLADRPARNRVEPAGADPVGIMVVTSRGDLRPIAVTEEQAAFFEFLQLQADVGPCLDAYREGHRVDVRDLAGSAGRRPRVVPFAVRSGYLSLHGLPLRVHRRTVGAVNLLLRRSGGLSEPDLELAQALADVTAVALVNWRPERLRATDISNRVQAALAAKATVDMATGMLAEAGGITPGQARAALRGYAERRRGRLPDAAHALVRRTLRPDAVLIAVPIPGQADAPSAPDQPGRSRTAHRDGEPRDPGVPRRAPGRRVPSCRTSPAASYSISTCPACRRAG